MYRINDNPVSRYPEGRALDDDKGLWMVARLKSRMEKAVALELARKGIGYYLPLYEKKTIRPDNQKPRKSVCPLFPGYLAFAGSPETQFFLKTHRRVVSLLPVLNQDKFVRELSQIQKILQSGLGLEVFSSLAEGDYALVKSGPLKGMEGVVLKKGRASRLVVGVEMFGQAVSVEVETGALEKVVE